MTPARLHPACIFALALLALPCAALAQEDTNLPLWELGVGGFGVSQQAYPGSSEQINRALVLPFFIYRGEFLRADRGTAGIRAIKTPTVEVDIGFAGAFGSNSNDIEARRGMPDLGTLVEFGPRLKWNLGAGPGGGRWRAELPVRGVFDISDGFANKGVSFEPELVFARRSAGGIGYNASIGAVLGNQKLADTFYGVAPAFANVQRPAYLAKSGLIAWRLGTSLSYNMTPDLRLFGFVRLDTVAGAANDASPLVDKRSGVSAGIGLAYTFMRSERRAAQ
jgi:outer membrane scaffolding protein for murein synthesis (MipA/OmpV family)